MKIDYENKLLECPFCGEEDDLAKCFIEKVFEHIHYIECEKCKARGPMIYYDDKLAIKTWNKRGEK